MAASTDINLPREYAACFPDQCVVCGAQAPNSHLRLITGTLGWWTWLLWWFGTPYVVKAPACRGCAWRLHGLRFISIAAIIATAFFALWIIWPHFKDSVPPAFRKWAMMGLGLLCLAPQILFEIFFARPFDVTAYSNSVDYEFTSRDYAIQFAMLNMNAAWVKVNGTTIKHP